MNIVNRIKQDNRPSLKEYFLASFLISQRISPYVSNIYIKKGVKPNKITLHMIYSGIIGAILFSMPNIYIKLLGALFIHLWFVLDCSDGEVARYTKQFSKYGKELDYMAHLINHPLFGISLCLSLMQFTRYKAYLLILLVMISNLLDYLTRNLNTLDIVINLKSKQKESVENQNNPWTIKEVLLFIASIFMVYPNFILFGVIIYFIDYLSNSNFLFLYLIINILMTFIFNLKTIIQLVRKFYAE